MFLVYIFVGVAAVICFSLAISFAVTQMHPQKITSSPGDYGLSFEEIHFSTRDNLRLHGWWIPSTNSRRTVIFLHGFNGSMDPDLKYAPGFIDAGFNVLMFDFRAHGRSEGKLTSLGAVEVLDAEAAIQYARIRGSEKIGLLGFSMGGRVALLTAARDKTIAALVSDGGPVRFSTAIVEGMKNKGIPGGFRQLLACLMMLGVSIRSGKSVFTNDPIRIESGELTIPTLLIHGELDTFTTHNDLLKMLEIIGGNGDLWVVKGIGHRETDKPNFESYLNKLINFFDTSM